VEHQLKSEKLNQASAIILRGKALLRIYYTYQSQKWHMWMTNDVVKLQEFDKRQKYWARNELARVELI